MSSRTPPHNLFDLLMSAKVKAAQEPPDAAKDPRQGQKIGLIMRVENGYPVGKAMCSAAEDGFVDVLRYFIEKENASPNSHDTFGQTPAIAAARAGQAQSLAYLIPISNLSLRDSSGQDALTAAAIEDHAECCALLAAHITEAGWNCDGWTALMFAAQKNNYSCVPYLVPCVRLGMRDKDGRDALSIAASHNHIQFIQAMLNLSPGPTDAAIARAIDVARRSSFDEANVNSCGLALIGTALMRQERKEISHVSNRRNLKLTRKTRL
jgi:hypothetical protein